MGLRSFLHGDIATKRKKLHKFLHRHDWQKAHRPSWTQKIKNEFYYLLHSKECIIITGWLVKFYDSKETYSNFGDDINVYFIELMTRKRVIPAATLLFPHKQYSVIGSTIPHSINQRTEIWGSGVLDINWSLRESPRKIYAVRGPLTRDYFIRHGCECPEVYGDPALLLPKFYQPKNSVKRQGIGLIPHHKDFDEPAKLEQLLSKYPDAKLINMTSYEKWTDVIDEMCSCEKVMSSSLHGLIVADAYGVSNTFCEFVHHHTNYDKFDDYFLSVKRPLERPIQFEQFCERPGVSGRENARKIEIDLSLLMSSCPFDI